ncbi:hypothetical protein BH09MYX1_BH09MYX1_33950 [soil metagenome]
MTHKAVSVGDQVYLSEGGEVLGSVRGVGRDHLVVYVENAGDFTVDAAAVAAVHDGKVVLDPAHIEPGLKAAARKAHDKETPGT